MDSLNDLERWLKNEYPARRNVLESRPNIPEKDRKTALKHIDKQANVARKRLKAAGRKV